MAQLNQMYVALSKKLPALFNQKQVLLQMQNHFLRSILPYFNNFKEAKNGFIKFFDSKNKKWYRRGI